MEFRVMRHEFLILQNNNGGTHKKPVPLAALHPLRTTSAANNYNTRLDSSVHIKTRIRTKVT